jgi:hypothetical protein
MTRLPDPDAMVFRSLAAPGLDEDDVIAAMLGRRAAGSIWGDGFPVSVAPPTRDSERQRRHDEILGRWPVSPGK